MSAIIATLERENHEYTVAGGRRVSLSVSEVLSLAGIVQPYPEIPQVMNFVEHARELGETVHQWCDHLDLGGDRETAFDVLRDSEPLPYFVAYTRFCAEHEPVWENVEQSFASLELDVAGTPDRIGTIKRGKNTIPVILDMKTAQQKAAYWPIQLSAYQYLSGRADCALYVLHLCGDGSYKLRPYEPDIETFLASVRIAQWRLKNGAKMR